MIDSYLGHNLKNFTEMRWQCFHILAVADAELSSENYTDMEEWKEKWEINQMIC